MNSCRECVHFKSCEDWVRTVGPENFSFPYVCDDNETPCDHYNPQTLPPVPVGTKVWSVVYHDDWSVVEGKITRVEQKMDKSWRFKVNIKGYVPTYYTVNEINSYIFLTKESAEEFIRNGAIR